MKTIGLIGGMSWESTAEYYRLINEGIKNRLGGLHSAKCILTSVDFAEIETLQSQGEWEVAGSRMVNEAKRLERAGADFIVLCTNTMHKLTDVIISNINIPFLHIADATAEKIVGDGIKHIGLLGTRFTMEEEFYKGRLERIYALDVITPTSPDREIVHSIIYNELCLGKILPGSKAAYKDILKNLAARGAEGIILGCTEIGLLIQQADSPVSLYDTTRIHAETAVEWALN